MFTMPSGEAKTPEGSTDDNPIVLPPLYFPMDQVTALIEYLYRLP